MGLCASETENHDILPVSFFLPSLCIGEEVLTGLLFGFLMLVILETLSLRAGEAAGLKFFLTSFVFPFILVAGGET